MDYREILTAKFQERRRNNPRYSLRAFAKDLKISPSRLSEVMSGKGSLSIQKGRQIAERLNMSALVAADFVDMIEAAGHGAQSFKDAAARRVTVRGGDVRTIALDEFAMVSDWRYLAIWTFMTLPQFDGDRKTIADHFKMNLIEVEDVLRRLERLKMVSVNGKNWVIGKTQFYTGGSVPHGAIRQIHSQMSALGRKSIEDQKFSERHLESAILTIDRSRYGEIQQKISKFCQGLVEEYGDHPANDIVYGLSLQFFKLAEPILAQKE